MTLAESAEIRQTHDVSVTNIIPEAVRFPTWTVHTQRNSWRDSVEWKYNVRPETTELINGSRSGVTTWSVGLGRHKAHSGRSALIHSTIFCTKPSIRTVVLQSTLYELLVCVSLLLLYTGGHVPRCFSPALPAVQSTRLSLAQVSVRDLAQVPDLQKMCTIRQCVDVVLHEKFWASRKHLATGGHTSRGNTESKLPPY